jgi:hypothetical protein
VIINEGNSGSLIASRGGISIWGSCPTHCLSQRLTRPMARVALLVPALLTGTRLRSPPPQLNTMSQQGWRSEDKQTGNCIPRCHGATWRSSGAPIRASRWGKPDRIPNVFIPGRVGKGANSPSESPGWVTAGANRRGVALRYATCDTTLLQFLYPYPQKKLFTKTFDNSYCRSIKL